MVHLFHSSNWIAPWTHIVLDSSWQCGMHSSNQHRWWQHGEIASWGPAILPGGVHCGCSSGCSHSSHTLCYLYHLQEPVTWPVASTPLMVSLEQQHILHPSSAMTATQCKLFEIMPWQGAKIWFVCCIVIIQENTLIYVTRQRKLLGTSGILNNYSKKTPRSILSSIVSCYA